MDEHASYFLHQNSDEIPILGRQVALLGICITDSVEDVSRQAREGVYRLYELLLHQIGKRAEKDGTNPLLSQVSHREKGTEK